MQRLAIPLIKGPPKPRLSALRWLDLYDHGTEISQYPPGGLSEMTSQVHDDDVTQQA